MVIGKEGPQGKHVSKAIQRHNFRERELLSIPDKSVRETQSTTVFDNMKIKEPLTRTFSAK